VPSYSLSILNLEKLTVADVGIITDGLESTYERKCDLILSESGLFHYGSIHFPVNDIISFFFVPE
jgi:hypothetical protein